MSDLHYLETVTPDVGATCDALARARGLTFGDPIPALGGARVAKLSGGGRLGVRAPMREDEAPIVRAYVRVDDRGAAANAVEAAGARILLPATPLEGEGTIVIYEVGGVQHGLWQP